MANGCILKGGITLTKNMRAMVWRGILVYCLSFWCMLIYFILRVMGAVLIGSRELYDSVAPLNINTPCLWEAAKDEKQEMTQDMYDLLYELQEECQKYISGDRAQMSLFKPEEDYENKTTA